VAGYNREMTNLRNYGDRISFRDNYPEKFRPRQRDVLVDPRGYSPPIVLLSQYAGFVGFANYVLSFRAD
jgi:hypothetical protein